MFQLRILFATAALAARAVSRGTAAVGLGIGLAALATAGAPAQAQQPELNLYSARHYQTDEALYANFTRQTGIRINRIEANDQAILERLRSEGERSPADVILLVDAARLWRAEHDGMFQPLRSQVLEQRIPQHLRGEDRGDGPHWYGFSTRARVIVYNKSMVDPALVRSYEDLARPELAGKVCTRTGSHPYMLSLIAAMTEHLGPEAAEKWAAGVVANFARKPRGGDTDQIRAVAVGECAVALTNTYYLVRLMRSAKPADREVVSSVGMVWPNQDGWGTHVNVSGGAIARNAPHREAAVRFLEYLASDQAQVYLAEGNNEWPAVQELETGNAMLARLGKFKADRLSLGLIGKAQTLAQRIVDRVGWR
ncbi:MAG: extracellular solute-binding protein [Burkholderiales bacterium]|nr:MAG: extracellular solute-binding protein [Burkholderiales bacterium]